MKNLIQSGDTVPLPAPYAVNGGDGLQVGALFGVATSAAAAGASVETNLIGVYDLNALSADVGAAGTKAYWDNANRRVTVTAAGNALIGALLSPKAANETTARVRLSGVAV